MPAPVSRTISLSRAESEASTRSQATSTCTCRNEDELIVLLKALDSSVAMICDRWCGSAHTHSLGDDESGGRNSNRTSSRREVPENMSQIDLTRSVGHSGSGANSTVPDGTWESLRTSSVIFFCTTKYIK